MAGSVVVEIRSDEVREKSGTSKAGKPYRISEQVAYLHLPGRPYPLECVVPLEDGDGGPYGIGLYDVDLGRTFYVAGFGQVQARVRLDRASRRALRDAAPAAVASK